MIENNINAFKVDQIDEEMLADLIFSKVYNKDSRLDEIIDNGYLTFKRNLYENQISLWKEFFNLKMRK